MYAESLQYQHIETHKIDNIKSTNLMQSLHVAANIRRCPNNFISIKTVCNYNCAL